MRWMQPPRRGSRPARMGFTLIELLIVLLIIAVLASLTAAGVFAVIGSQRVSNTKTTLNKLAPMVKLQWNTVAEKAFRDWANNQATAKQYQSLYVTPIAGSDPGRQSVVYVKLKLVQTFPMSFDEVLNTNAKMLPSLKVYQSKLKALGISGSTTPPAPYESSALLLMALQEGISGQKINPEDLGSASLGNFSAGSGTIQALVDGWGSPIAFVRWPTGSSDLNPSGAQTGTNFDPTDPQGYLTSSTWQASGTTTSFATGIGYTLPAAGKSYTLYPLLVSPGPDSSLYSSSQNASDYHLGLDQNANSTGTDSTDNITSAAQ